MPRVFTGSGNALRWRIQVREGALAFVCDPYSGPEALATNVLSGVEARGEGAELPGVTEGALSKWAKKSHKAGRIRICRNALARCSCRGLG